MTVADTDVENVFLEKNTFKKAIALSQTADREVEIKTRDALPNYPVPYLRPTKENAAIAFDLCPNGVPGGNGPANRGYAWLDVCNADLENFTGLNCIGLGAGPSEVTLGCYSYGDASPIPMALRMTGVLVAKIETNKTFSFHKPAAVSSLGYRNKTTKQIVSGELDVTGESFVSLDDGESSVSSIISDTNNQGLYHRVLIVVASGPVTFVHSTKLRLKNGVNRIVNRNEAVEFVMLSPTVAQIIS